MDILFYLFVTLLFFAVALLFESLYMIWNARSGPEARRIARRLQLMSAGGDGSQASVLAKQRMLANAPGLERLLLQIPRIHALDRLLVQSGSQLQVGSFLGIVAGMALAGLLVGFVLGWPGLLVVGAMFAMAALPWLAIFNARERRMTQIEQQLPDALDLMGRAMLAGHAFPSALKMVGEEMAQPVAGEFRIVFDEINYGIPIQDAMSNLATRVPSTDLRYFVISVLIQRETGGNLAELLGNISALIRARLKLLGTVRVLSAEGVLSAKILTALPFVLGLVINLVNPGFLQQLWTDPVGIKLVWFALIMMAVGIFWMWRIIRIRI